MATASFQLLLLMLFLFANYWDNKPKLNKITPKAPNIQSQIQERKRFGRLSTKRRLFSMSRKGRHQNSG